MLRKNKGPGGAKSEVVGRLGIEYDTRTTGTRNYTPAEVKAFRDGILVCADRNGASSTEIRELLEMLGYLPTRGHVSRNGHRRKVEREAYFEIA